jgi:hypothetical protein
MSGQDIGLAQCLVRPAADSADPNERNAAAVVSAVHLLAREREYRLEETYAGVANGELRGVHADRESARARRGVIAREGALMAVIESACVVERERVGRDDEAARERTAEIGGGH